MRQCDMQAKPCLATRDQDDTRRSDARHSDTRLAATRDTSDCGDAQCYCNAATCDDMA